MVYAPQTWVDGPGGGTPVSAARLAVMEAGIVAASVGELDGAAEYSNFTIPNTNTWTDIPCQVVVPAGVPWDGLLVANLAGTRNATADATAKVCQVRLVDAATATIIGAHIMWQDAFATASIIYVDKKVDIQPNDPLAVDTVYKVQAIASANANMTWSLYAVNAGVTPGAVAKVVMR